MTATNQSAIDTAWIHRLKMYSKTTTGIRRKIRSAVVSRL